MLPVTTTWQSWAASHTGQLRQSPSASARGPRNCKLLGVLSATPPISGAWLPREPCSLGQTQVFHCRPTSSLRGDQGFKHLVGAGVLTADGVLSASGIENTLLACEADLTLTWPGVCVCMCVHTRVCGASKQELLGTQVS